MKPSVGIKWFVDTNVLVYLVDRRFPEKQSRAAAWLKMMRGHGRLSLSPQIINETCAVLIRKPISADEAIPFVRSFLRWCDAPLDRETSRIAMDLYEQHRLSWWDCVLVASALQIKADYLLSEDLQDGRSFGRLRIVDPFRIAPDDFLAASPGSLRSS